MNIFERAGFIKVEDGVWTDPSLRGQNTIYIRECGCNQPPHYVACGEYEPVSSIGKKLFPFIDSEKYLSLDRDLRRRLFVPVRTKVGRDPFTIHRIYVCDLHKETLQITIEYEPRTENSWLISTTGQMITDIDKYIKGHIYYPNSIFALTTRLYNMNEDLCAAHAKIEQLTAALNSAIDQINELREALAYAPGGPIAEAAAESFRRGRG